MWKYVTRRVKDSVERTYNVFDTRRTWTCGGVPSATTNGDTLSVSVSAQQSTNLLCIKEQKWGGSSSSGRNDFKQKFGNKCFFQQSFLEALTWSSAIVCGWYTSQLICTRRRNHNQSPFPTRCKFYKVLQVPNQAFHTKVLSYWALAAPEISRKHCPWTDNGYERKNDSQKYLYQVRDVSQGDELLHPKHKKPQTVESAVEDLLTVLGDIEYRLGVQNIEAENFEIAVSHFKLATSHRNASATFNLGICYEQGIGVNKNMKMALECYLAASSLGHSKAMYNVGIFYVHGLGGLKKDRDTARQYFTSAAKLGQLEAKLALGIATNNDDKYLKSDTLIKNAILTYVAVA